MWNKIWDAIYPYRNDLQFILHFFVIYAVSKFNSIYTQYKKDVRPLANFFPALLCTALVGIVFHIKKLELAISLKVFIDVLVGYTSHEIVKRVTAPRLSNFFVKLFLGYVAAAMKANGLEMGEDGVPRPIEEEEKKKEGETTDENDKKGQDTIKDVSDSEYVAKKSNGERGFRISSKR